LSLHELAEKSLDFLILPRTTPDFMASENDWKCERIFEDADDGLINFSQEFLTQACLPLVVPLSASATSASAAKLRR
jgi:hypothetical protein